MSLTVPTWLIERLGVTPSAEGVSWQLESAWNWPPWMTLLFVVLAVGWVTGLYLRESSEAGKRYRGILIGLRLAALALVLAMLAEYVLTGRRTAPPPLILIVDRSASMNTVDQYENAELRSRLQSELAAAGLGELTRLNLAKWALMRNDVATLHELASKYRVETYFAAGTIERQPDDINALAEAIGRLSADSPDSNASRLGDAVRSVLSQSAGAPPAAIILMSDGITSDGASLGDVAGELRNAGVPLIVLGLGSDVPPRDVKIADVLVDETVFIDDLVAFQVNVGSKGLEGRAARIVLRRQDQPEPLASQSITLGESGQTQTVMLTSRATKPGSVEFLLEVSVAEAEFDLDNNRQSRTVIVRDQKVRVLLASAAPSYEYRYLKTLLEREASIELATYLQEADLEYADQDRTALRSFPIDRESLLDYDVVILSDVDPGLIPRSTWRNLLSVISDAGRGLVMIGGPRHLPWDYWRVAEAATLLPIVADAAMLPNQGSASIGFRPQPTPIGFHLSALQLAVTIEESRKIWTSLPPLYWFLEAGRLKPAAQVLAEHSQRTGPDGRNLPIIVQQFVGRGRVLFHATDETWRWRFRLGDVYFARYWIQMIRHLARGTLQTSHGAELATDRREYSPGEAVRLRARFMAGAPSVADAAELAILLEGGEGGRKTIALNPLPDDPQTFEAVAGDLAPGGYTAMLVQPSADGEPPKAMFSIVRRAAEMEQLEMDRTELTDAANTSRGKFYSIAEVEELFAGLPRGRPVSVEDLPPVPLWNRWWIVLLFLSLVSTEWIMRKRKGML